MNTCMHLYLFNLCVMYDVVCMLCLFVSMHVCVCVLMFVHVHVHVGICGCMYVHTSLYVHVHVHCAIMHVLCVCTYERMCERVYMYYVCLEAFPRASRDIMYWCLT